MADVGDLSEQSTSPKENYDPLQDEMDGTMDVANCQETDEDADHSDEDEYHETEERLQSIDADQEEKYFNAQGQDIAEFPFTPPVNNSRIERRERQGRSGRKQQQSYKEYKNIKAMEKKEQKSFVNVIKEGYGVGNALFSGLTNVDSDVDLERENRPKAKDKKQKERDEKQKRLTTNRSYDRLVKRASEDLTAREINLTETSPMDIVTPVVPVKLSGSGRFLSLSAASNKVIPVSPISADRLERRQPSISRVQCPKDRLGFYQAFAALINMGSHGKKQKESKEKERFLTQRQKSRDEKLLQYYIWIGLQAWLNGCQPVDQEEKVKAERERIPGVLQEILDFKVQLPQAVLGFKIGEQSIPEMTDFDTYSRMSSHCSIDTESSRTDISETYHSMRLISEMFCQQQEAIKQVHKLLQKLDRCEQLFPTSSAFAQEFEVYKDSAFVKRLESLYLWLNITQDLCEKLKLLGKVLNIKNIQGDDWPFLEFESPRYQEQYSRELSQLHRTSISEIRSSYGEGEGGDGESDACELEDNSKGVNKGVSDKRVSFKMENDRRVSFTGHASPKREPSPSNVLGSPSDASTPIKGPLVTTSLSRASSEASLEEISRQSVYRNFVDGGLKKMGLSKMLVRLRDILDKSLQRAKRSLEKQGGESTINYDTMCKSPAGEDYHLPTSPSLDLLDKASVTLTQVSCTLDISPDSSWMEHSLDIGLPSFRPTYMFLVRVLLKVIHEAIMIRLEQLENPDVEPSFLSIRQIIRECKDILAKAVLVKQYYQHMIAAVLDDNELAAENSPMDLDKFDDDMSDMFKMYFRYLQKWLHHLQNLPEASRSLKNPLEDEWSFSKKVCPHVIGGEAEAGKKFSTLAISLLNSIGDFLESGIDEYVTNLYDWTTERDTDDTDNEDSYEDSYEDEKYKTEEIDWETSPNPVFKDGEGGQNTIPDDVEDIQNTMSGDVEDDQNLMSCDVDDGQNPKSKSNIKQSFQKTCRNFKNLFHEARERASKALGFAKLLRKDLEIAADFNVVVTTVEILKMLKETNHVQLQVPLSAGYLMFIPEWIIDQRRQILQLLNVTCGREDITVSTDLTSKNEGYLLMVRCSGGIDRKSECPLWTGKSIKVEPTAETVIALSHLQVESLLLVVIHSSQLTKLRKDFESQMGDTVELVNEQTSCHQVIAESLIELKEAAISLRDIVATVIQKVEGQLNFDIALGESEKKHVLKLYRETMLQAYNFGFEYMKEVTRLVSGETRHKLGKGLVLFAKDWMKFVSEKCEMGRGMRPRWADQGLDFLLVACEPRVLAHLSEQEYQELQQSINEFIRHLIGTADKSSYSAGGGLPMPRSSAHVSTLRQPFNRSPSCPAPSGDARVKMGTNNTAVGIDPPQTAPASISSSNCTKKSPLDSNFEVDLHDGADGGIEMEVRRRHRASGDFSSGSVFRYKPQYRIESKIKELEQARTEKLHDQRVIGRVINKKSEVSYHINTRRVNFHWQKGNKIGEGQFGKVYCAVNHDTGEMMAMKEMKFTTADMQARFKEIIDEIKIFEGINHPNLVKYYGVEVHRTEMLVFMEYCDRGTLDVVSKQGLPEDLVRRYTKELLIAVQVLHEHGILHRDIKGANIFLTSTGCLKLGDFGCSVKLKNHTTMAGEVNALVGTTAYMAPEVITCNEQEGHGRAADIWSVGCVVIEMVSGKRPWHELEGNYQIMFKVGMGMSPPIPENLGAEGKDFLKHCILHNPRDRWTAVQLRDHPFAKIYDPEVDDDDTGQG